MEDRWDTGTERACTPLSPSRRLALAKKQGRRPACPKKHQRQLSVPILRTGPAPDDIEAQRSHRAQQENCGTGVRDIADNVIAQARQQAGCIKAGPPWAGKVQRSILPFRANLDQAYNVAAEWLRQHEHIRLVWVKLIWLTFREEEYPVSVKAKHIAKGVCILEQQHITGDAWPQGIMTGFIFLYHSMC